MKKDNRWTGLLRLSEDFPQKLWLRSLQTLKVTSFTVAKTLRVDIRKIQVLKAPMTWDLFFSMPRDLLGPVFNLRWNGERLYGLTALFTNMGILKFKSQLTIAFFAAVNHLNRPVRTKNFTLTGSKGQGLWFVNGGFWSVVCVSVFQGCLLVIVIMIDGSERRRLLNFRVRTFVKSAVNYLKNSQKLEISFPDLENVRKN